ncbi:MAG: energy transducer TonB [Bacteroidales bacterium]|nr:energy transducer TonB [Bacteroidales bacterium]
MKKRDDDRQGKDRRFIELPEYPGGKTAFQEFIRKNLRYPEEALKAGIEGQVHLHYWVEGNGRVVDAEVTHGLGYGCDEEALRLVKLLKYGRIKNRGLRVKASMRTRIDFRLPARTSLNYEFKSTVKPTPPARVTPQENTSGGTITWTITIPPPDSKD